MFICSICLKGVISPTFLIDHLKYCHNNSVYKCMQNNCPQQFPSSSRFKKHLINVHKTDCAIRVNNTNSNNESKQPLVLNSPELSNQISNTVEFPINSSETTSTKNDVNDLLPSVTKRLLDAFLKFSLKLHDNDNFNRKDV